MRIKGIGALQSKKEIVKGNSEELSENSEYIKKLQLQHRILNKFLVSDVNQTTTDTGINQSGAKPENPGKTKK